MKLDYTISREIDDIQGYRLDLFARMCYNKLTDK